MSHQLIHEYRADLDQLRAVTGSRRETNLRPAFARLLRSWGRQQDLVYTEEHQRRTNQGNLVAIDGALSSKIGVPFGYWEAKDENDDLEKEITAKFRKGYPDSNIIFSDDITAILYQDGHEAMRATMDDTGALFALLTRFFAHERAEVAHFRTAVRQFAAGLPTVLKQLRGWIADKRQASAAFARAEADFLAHAQGAINPAVTQGDVQEMLIQHVLTEDIFAKVFGNPDFHRQNNVAAALYALEGHLFGYGEKQKLLKGLGPYYASIQSTAALIDSHSEKQGFLKGLYENFYKVYNPHAADRLGVVYTPGEIVRFMIRGADYLCEQHFGKNLADKGVEILDPATGTGTFIVELLEHFRGHHDKLRHKYHEELHANEVAILPYYVANLNIEATYATITGEFAEYPNLCFVDTLDNVAGLGVFKDEHFGDLLGALSDENMARVKRQNTRKISVIIGNPPYNANQQNENDNNKNREYKRVDARIKATYIKASHAQKTKMYDMYVRFFRWASDRLGDEGVLAFITNRSFIDAHMADGFRRSVATDFAEGWVVDLGGDYKKQGVGGGGNVFGIGTGVAISFWVKRQGHSGPARLHYLPAPAGTGDDKLAWVHNRRIEDGGWQTLAPRADAAWVDIPDAETAGMLPLVSRDTKLGHGKDQAIFKLYSLGVVTNRDDWVYDSDPARLDSKVDWLLADYHSAIADKRPWAKADADEPRFQSGIKWTRALKALARKRVAIKKPAFRQGLYRPFAKRWLAYSPQLNEMLYQQPAIFPFEGGENQALCVSDPTSQKPFLVCGIDAVPDLHFVGAAAGTICTPRYRYTKSGERVDNITDWALAQFTAHYGASPLPSPEGPGPEISKDAIFAYCYAVLHDPIYRATYALNLRREFPRIPLYPGFAQWVAWGQALLALHIGYEGAAPFAFTRIDTPLTDKGAPKRAAGTHPRPKLKSLLADGAATGAVLLDEDTQLAGIPRAAWDYRLGNRSAIDWVLDQHKEKPPRDPTIRARFNTYRFADHKEACIALLARVVTVSVETVAITQAMRALDRAGWQ